MGWEMIAKLAGVVAAKPDVAFKAAKAGGKALLVGSIVVPFGSYVAWNRFVNGEDTEEAAIRFFSPKIGNAYAKAGVVGAVKQVTAGEDAVDKGAGEVVVDAVAGDGAAKKIGEEVSKLYNKTKDVTEDVVDGTGDALRAGRDAVADAYNGARGMMSGFVTGPDGQQQYIPPTGAEDYQRQAMMQYYQTQQYQQQYANSGDGLFGGLNMFSGIGNMMGSIFSGGKGLSLAAIIPAAMLMFGNFGWFGKIASLMLGSLAYKNMTNQRMLQPQPAYQQVVPQVQQQVVPQGYSPQLVLTPGQGHQSLSEQLALSDQDNNVVKRSRA